MFLPAVAVVDHHLGIPLGKVEAAALSTLAPGHGGGPRVPLEVYRDRIAGRERLGQNKSHDGAVGRKGIDRPHRVPQMRTLRT